MNLVKCPKGHYYNADKLKSCPHCANEKVHIDNTTNTKQGDIDTYVPERQHRKTYEKACTRPIAGWLVCIAGNMKGDCFTLFTGKNHIGRDPGMDILLMKEPTVSRWNHAVITYHTDTTQFTLDTESETVWWNETSVQAGNTVTLACHDRIQIGDCVLIFVPFCGKDFQWNE